MNQVNNVGANTGIVHFWELPKGNRVVLSEKAKNALVRLVKKKYGSSAQASCVAGIGKTTLNRYIREKGYKLTVDILLKICKVINDSPNFLKKLEKSITWIGFGNSQGVVNPKLPFNFNSRPGARFLAAICNDGWISDGVYYSYSEKDLQESVKADALAVFGGDTSTIKNHEKANDKFLRFPSVIRDTLMLITDFKGVKSENNPKVPEFIFKNNYLICGWIEQTIADEGYVKYFPDLHRREISWKRAFKLDLSMYKLHLAEKRMLDKIGISYDVYNAGEYTTKDNIKKTCVRIMLTKRSNLLKLRNLIKIPCKRKNATFTEALKSYTRYKEPQIIKESIIRICNEVGYVDSALLKKFLSYKSSGTAIRWIKFYANQGLLAKTHKSLYISGHLGAVAAKYVLNQNVKNLKAI